MLFRLTILVLLAQLDYSKLFTTLVHFVLSSISVFYCSVAEVDVERVFDLYTFCKAIYVRNFSNFQGSTEPVPVSDIFNLLI